MPSRTLTVLLVPLFALVIAGADARLARGDDSGQRSDSASETPPGIDPGAARMPDLETVYVKVFGKENRLWLVLNAKALAEQKAVIPRLCSPIRSIGWSGSSREEIKFAPEPDEWVFSWKAAAGAEGKPEELAIDVVLERPPTLLANAPSALAAADGSVLLHAYQAKTVGEKLRYEPQWYKNTVGYWTVPSDYATWELTIDQPGEFSVAVLQGCGQGQGGSQASLSLRKGDAVVAQLEFTTIDTGHFQNFRWNHLGKLTIDEAGSYQLRLEAKRIAKAALFDARMIHLVRQAKAEN